MDHKRHIVRALKRLLRPIAKLLIELGFSFRDFNEVAKLVYVDVATTDYGLKGRKTNMSRVALMTGLTRREVTRLRKVMEHELPEPELANTVAGKVLAAWYQEPDYQNDLGEPRPLPLQGDVSVTAIVDQFRGDIPATAVIKELERVGAIQVRGGHARATTRYYMPAALAATSIERFGDVLHDLGGTITHNLLDAGAGAAWFEGRASNEAVSAHSVEAFRNFLDRKGQIFLEEVDDWLKDHEADAGDADRVRLGIGMYAIENGEPQDV